MSNIYQTTSDICLTTGNIWRTMSNIWQTTSDICNTANNIYQTTGNIYQTSATARLYRVVMKRIAAKKPHDAIVRERRMVKNRVTTETIKMPIFLLKYINKRLWQLF